MLAYTRYTIIHPYHSLYPNRRGYERVSLGFLLAMTASTVIRKNIAFSLSISLK